MIQEVKIAGSRVGVLIGKGGATKRELEAKTHATITIDSKEGIVKVEGTEEHTISLLRCVEIINAINYGFSPERAFEMIDDEDLLLEVIDLSGMADGPRQLDRLRGRIIGKDGRAREQIEDMTDVEISVFGKTVAMIGYPEQLKTARTAVDMLIEGVPHENVFAFLDRKKKEAKQDMISYYY
ncbi:MAG: RNA-processing protein [Methanomicrobiales archaeon HGW-Methanomicrobiales-1]|jgi:ribosomal RNA assembly protein|nr:MAG: RNA-processing protein [Methanomicrobiales archaeon HGW-Methanomicrobiales-1]